MKHTLILTLSLLFSISTFSQEISIRESYQIEKEIYSKKATFSENMATANYDILYHRILWYINPAKRYISGEVTSHFMALQNATQTICFDLDNTLIVDSIKCRDSKIAFGHSNDIITATLPTPIDVNVIDSLTIYYRGVPTSTGFGSFTTSVHSSSYTPVLWTLSEPYGAMEWWPCKQSLSDKIDSIDIYVETPSEYSVASNGVLVYEDISSNTKRTYWKHRHPITTYLVAIAVTDYTIFSDYAKLSPTDSVEILNYVYPESYNSVRNSARYTVDAMEVLSELFIDYPFKNEKYGHAQFGWGGGMEHQTMSFMGGFSQGLIVHELAHQWFGNHVTCGSWEDIWVNEGFAVFCEGLVIEKLHPQSWMNWKKSEMEHILLNAKSGSVFVDDTSSVDRIFDWYLTYKKGGILVHMLRNQVGDTAFFNGINEMLTNSKTSGKFASQEDVQKYLEDASGISLDYFFDTWYYGQGYPVYTFNIEKANNDSISFSVSQSTTHSSVDFFPMYVPVKLIGVDTSTVVKIHHSQNNQLFELETGFKVNYIEFDPDYTILAPHPAYINGSGLVERDWTKSVTVAPNPVNEVLDIRLDNTIKLKKTEVVDMTGKVVYSSSSPENSNHIRVPFNEYKTGQYIVRIFTNKGVTNSTVIKTPE